MIDTTNPHAAGAQSTRDGYYVALCPCGWSDLPRMGWLNAMRDVTYHLHKIGQHSYDCHYCRDERLGIPVSDTQR
jgi:hypothetical protein